MSPIVLLSLLMSSPAVAACTVLSGEGAQVYLPGGVVDADLVLADGQIRAVGADVGGIAVSKAGEKATFGGQPCSHVDISGKSVTAGLIEVGGSLGLTEVGMESGSVDSDSGAPSSIRAGFRVSDAYNPLSTLIPVTRVHGVTSALSSPSGGRIAGQAAWVQLHGATQAEAVVKPYAALTASLGASSTAQALRELRQALADARWYRSHKADYDRNAARPLVAAAEDLEALWPVLDRQVPIVVHADRASDIEALLRFAADEKVRVVITGAAEAWMHADALAEAGVAVAIDPTVYSAGSWDQIHARPDGPARLAEAGVDLIISGGWTHNLRALRQLAGNAVRGGLDHDAAVTAITAAPAAAFGIDDRGVLRAGAVADVVVWEADPLELGSAAEHVFIAGTSIDKRSRQTELRDRYRDLPGSPVEPLELP